MNRIILFSSIYILCCIIFGFPKEECFKIYSLYFFIAIFIFWILLPIF